jgi:hypothetical protein
VLISSVRAKDPRSGEASSAPDSMDCSSHHNASQTPRDQDSIAWGAFQEVRCAWENVPSDVRTALHPAMRAALALRILFRHRAQAAVNGIQHRELPPADVIRQRAEESIRLAVRGLASLELEGRDCGIYICNAYVCAQMPPACITVPTHLPRRVQLAPRAYANLCAQIR